MVIWWLPYFMGPKFGKCSPVSKLWSAIVVEIEIQKDAPRKMTWYQHLGFETSNSSITSGACSIFVLPALAGKTHRDHFVPVVRWCCLLLLLLSVVKRVNIWLYLPHALMDFYQSWAIDAIWEPSFVDEVKGHISRSKVIWGQVVR